MGIPIGRISLLMVLLWIAAVSETLEARKTSIVLLLGDDLGYGDVEYNSVDSTNGARTPELNAMSKSPTVFQFNNFHSMTSCSPSRSSFVSGRSPEKECVTGANSQFDKPGIPYQDDFPFRAGMPSIARSAKLAGYATALFGKWHLGPLTSRSPGAMGFDTWIASTGNQPTYDESCLTPEEFCFGACTSKASTIYQCRAISKRRCTSPLSNDCYLGHYDSVFDFGPNWSTRMFSPSPGEPPNSTHIEVVNITRGLESSEFLVDQFEQFVRKVPIHQAFFVYLWFHEPHAPFIASPKIAHECMAGIACKTTYTSVTMPVDYYGTVVALDQAVGRVRSLLKEIDRANDTLLIFTSDNGPADPRVYGGAGSAGTFRGFKGDILEGSHRVPFLLEWPSRITFNAKIEGVVSVLDLFPTFQALFKSEAPELDFAHLNERPTDGLSILPLLLLGNKSANLPRVELGLNRTTGYGICHEMETSSSVFCSDFVYISDNWRAISVRKGVAKDFRESQMMLFDVKTDPKQLTNLAHARPDILNALFPVAVTWMTNIQYEHKRVC